MRWAGFSRWNWALIAAMSLAACGGGGGGSSSAPLLPLITTPAVTDLIVSVDPVSLTNSGSDSATLTVTALDRSRNVMASAPVTVSVGSNGVFVPETLGGVTASNGNFVGKILIGNDKSNRLIPYTVRSGTLTRTGNVTVSGVVLSASTSPVTPEPGQAVTLTASMADINGTAIPDTALTLNGLPGIVTASTRTDSRGQASFRFNAPQSEGIYPLVIAGAGASRGHDLRVVLPGSDTVPVAAGPISGASAIATPAVIGVNTAGSTARQSEVRVLFVAANNTPISNVRVRFDIVSPALPGEALSSASEMSYSDTSGVAKTRYIAPTIGSPNDGVIVRACYATGNFAVNECPNAVTARLTVAAAPTALTIGVGNSIEKSPSGISYIKKFEIQAVDAAGNYARDVPLSATVSIEGYRKAANHVAAGIWCLNEDTNRNGVLDTLPVNEDANGDGFLTPRQSDVAISFVDNVSKTNASGQALVQLQYPQNVATWLNVRIKVNAGVAGSEGEATFSYVLGFDPADELTGSFRLPPYGANTVLGCSTSQ